MTNVNNENEEKEQKSTIEEEVRDFNVFLLERLFDNIQKMHESLAKIENDLKKKHIKMMEGFRCIERAFKTLSGSIMSLADDLGSATGTIASDPWTFDL